jgi:hypothetical protein
MLRVHSLLIGCLIATCAIPALLDGQEQRTIPAGGVSGHAAIVSDSGKPIAPDDAKVWILFGSIALYGGLPESYVDSSALQFENQVNHSLAQDKKAIQSLLAVARDKSKSDTEKREAFNQYQGYAIKATDQALAATVQWAQQRGKKTWQVKSLTPAPDGAWSTNDLIPGIYQIVIRARFRDFDVAWEASITVKSGQISRLQDAPPRWFYQNNSQ